MKEFGWTMFWVCFGAIVGALIMHGWCSVRSVNTVSSVETVVDTIPYFVPIAKDSLVIRYETRVLPVADTIHADALTPLTALTRDSAMVEIPIERKVWEDSLWRVQATGYGMQLERVDIYQRKDVVTVREKAKRWHLGVSAGYGFTDKGMRPYVGIGVTYSIIGF